MVKAIKLKSGDFILKLSNDEALTIMATIFVVMNGDTPGHHDNYENRILPLTLKDMRNIVSTLQKAGLSWQEQND